MKYQLTNIALLSSLIHALQEDEEVPIGHLIVEIRSVSQDLLAPLVEATLPVHRSPVSVLERGKPPLPVAVWIRLTLTGLSVHLRWTVLHSRWG